MANNKTKIVLDADVIIHFAKGGRLSLLPRILPEFQYLVLDVVKREIPQLLLFELERIIKQDKTIQEETFGSSPGEIKEYARLIDKKGPALGKGESSCLVYCRYHNDVVGSSNTKDVTDYCAEHGITYLTTNDFLYYAIKRGLMTAIEAECFVKDVRSKGSYPPIEDFNTYFCNKI